MGGYVQPREGGRRRTIAVGPAFPIYDSERSKIMRMSTMARRTDFFATVGVLLIALLLSGCPSAGEKPAKQPPAGQTKTAAARQTKVRNAAAGGDEAAAKPESPEKDLSQELEEVAEKPRDLGPPLVDDPGKLRPPGPETAGLDRQAEQAGRPAGRGLQGRVSAGVLRHLQQSVL